MLPVKQALKELSDAAAYERLLGDAYKKVSLKEVIPLKQQEEFNFEDDLKLQQNLTKNNLNTLFQNQPALVNQIIQYIIDTDGDLVEFNKYFNTFKTSIAGIRIRSIEDFQKVWNQFKSQRLGIELAITPEVIFQPNTLTIPELERKTNEELDNLFKQALVNAEKKPLSEIKNFRYQTKTSLSKLINIKPMTDGTLTLDPIPTESNAKTDLQRINTAKIRYIYKANNPNASMRINVLWREPSARASTMAPVTAVAVTTTSSVPPPAPAPKTRGRPRSKSISSLPPVIPVSVPATTLPATATTLPATATSSISTSTEGSGLITNPLFQKKRSVYMKYR